MKAVQRNVLAMFQTLIRFYDANIAIIQTVPALFDIYNLFKSKVISLEQLIMLLDMKTTGPTKDKMAIRSNLCSIAAQTAGCLRAFASRQGNNALRHKAKYSSHELLHTNDESLPGRCQNIYDLAVKYSADITDFGIDTGFLSVFQQTLDAFTGIKKTPRMLRAENKSNNELFLITFKETRIILRLQLDDGMLIFKTRNPEFYRSYRNARVIVDLTGKKKVVSDPNNIAYAYGSVSATDGSLLPDTVISFESAEVTITVNVDEDSEYFAEYLTAGVWNIIVECFGYETARIENYTIEDGDEISLDFSMVPTGALEA